MASVRARNVAPLRKGRRNLRTAGGRACVTDGLCGRSCHGCCVPARNQAGASVHTDNGAVHVACWRPIYLRLPKGHSIAGAHWHGTGERRHPCRVPAIQLHRVTPVWVRPARAQLTAWRD